MMIIVRKEMMEIWFTTASVVTVFLKVLTFYNFLFAEGEMPKVLGSLNIYNLASPMNLRTYTIENTVYSTCFPAVQYCTVRSHQNRFFIPSPPPYRCKLEQCNCTVCCRAYSTFWYVPFISSPTSLGAGVQRTTGSLD